MFGSNTSEVNDLNFTRKEKKLGHKLVVLESCESTNAIALKLAQENAPDGTVILAKHQTKGKGRLNRSWESWPGNLALSIITRPHLKLQDASRILNASTIGTIRALRTLGIPAFIKWPNDILVHSESKSNVPRLGGYRKVGGILLELTSTNNLIDAAVIGIGLNLCRPPENFEGTVIPQMGFIEHSCGTIPLTTLVNELLDALETALATTDQSSGYQALLGEIKSRSCLLGKNVKVECGDQTIEGLAYDIDLDGALLIKTGQGAIQKIYYGDVYVKEFL